MRLHAITERECVEVIAGELAAGRGGWVYTPNVDHLRRLRQSPPYAALCASASLVVADGMPLVWACRLAGTPVPGRVAGSDLISSLSEAAARDGRSIFMLGGNPGSADGAAALLRVRHPALAVRGTLCPLMGFEDDPAALEGIAAELVRTQPDIVFVGLSSPLADRMVARLRPLLPRAWWLTIGISFSFLTGEVQRAPRWLRAVGLEWAHRLMQEPRRLSGRYLVHGLPFVTTLFARAAWSRAAGRRRVAGSARGSRA